MTRRPRVAEHYILYKRDRHYSARTLIDCRCGLHLGAVDVGTTPEAMVATDKTVVRLLHAHLRQLERDGRCAYTGCPRTVEDQELGLCAEHATAGRQVLMR